MRLLTKILFIVGVTLFIGGAFDPLYNGADVIGMFTLIAAFMSLGMEDA